MIVRHFIAPEVDLKAVQIMANCSRAILVLIDFGGNTIRK